MSPDDVLVRRLDVLELGNDARELNQQIFILLFVWLPP